MGMERYGSKRGLFEYNKKIIIATQSVCAICGAPVDKRLKFPNPYSATIDHIIPLSRGGDPTALDNMQLAHMKCNRAKSNKTIPRPVPQPDSKEVDPNYYNKMLPQSHDWRTF